MSVRLSDNEIAKLLKEKKPLPNDYPNCIRTKPKRSHKERELDVIGAEGSEFRVIFRQGEISPLDFSVILTYRPKDTNLYFRLRRYNGKSHEHTNTLENQTFYDFHIHTASEKRYSDYNGAIKCLLADCNFVFPPNFQVPFSFDGGAET